MIWVTWDECDGCNCWEETQFFESWEDAAEYMKKKGKEKYEIEVEERSMANGYKEMVLQKLWENQHPMTYNELCEDVAYFDIDRFEKKFDELINDGYIYMIRYKRYWLTDKAIESIEE